LQGVRDLTSTRSPAAWPSVSLIDLNSSMSMASSAVRPAIARASRCPKARRVPQPGERIGNRLPVQDAQVGELLQARRGLRRKEFEQVDRLRVGREHQIVHREQHAVGERDGDHRTDAGLGQRLETHGVDQRRVADRIGGAVATCPFHQAREPLGPALARFVSSSGRSRISGALAVNLAVECR
jgi:hypothetical protein